VGLVFSPLDKTNPANATDDNSWGNPMPNYETRTFWQWPLFRHVAWQLGERTRTQKNRLAGWPKSRAPGQGWPKYARLGRRPAVGIVGETTA